MKLTDEEIVMSLCAQRQHLLNEQRLTGRAPDEQIVYVTGGAVFEILDLIHRLQADYSNLKERYVKVLDLNEKVIAKQQAEIERLTEERDKLFNANVDTQEELNKVRLDRNRENTELQKQVDELKAENTELYKEHTALIAGSILKQQDIAKETAKEICGLILEHWEKKQFVECDWLRVAIAEKYGVKED